MAKMHVEVTDPKAPLWLGVDHERPVETEADRIAAAEDIGTIWVRPMAQLIPEHPGRFCKLCTDDPAIVQQLQREREAIQAEFLAEYEVEWDPTITL